MNDHDGTPIEFILSHDEASPGPPIFLNDGRKVYWTDGVVFTHPDGRRTFHDYSPRSEHATTRMARLPVLRIAL